MSNDKNVKCPFCSLRFDDGDENYEIHLNNAHKDAMDLVLEFEYCSAEREYENLIKLVEIGYGGELPEKWRGKDMIVDIFYLHGWEAVVYVGEALRKNQDQFRRVTK